MPGMSSSPHTPRHSRHSSIIDSVQGSPQARRYSKSSMLDPSSLSHQDSLDIHILSTGSTASGNGMGNLADELADAFSESGDEERDEEEEDERSEVGEKTEGGKLAVEGEDTEACDTASGKHTWNEARILEKAGACVDEATTFRGTGHRENDGSLAIPSPQKRSHQRKGSEYDGSEYGSESDLDSAGMPPTLLAKIDAIESLARRGTGSYGSTTDDVFIRVTHALRDLGSQSTVEGSASR